MDSLTQAALGAAIGEITLGKKIGKKAALIGAIIATFPDLDIVLYPFFNQFERISIHRGYSHSFAFCIIGALLFAFILQKMAWTRHLKYGRLLLLCFLLLVTHVLLDAFTPYGTQLFLPFSDYRVSFDSISIVDPVYTLPLLAGVLISIFYFKPTDKKREIPNKIGLTVSTLYLLLTLVNKQHIDSIYSEQLTKEGIEAKSFLSVPVSAGNLIWYGVAKDEENLNIGKYSLIENNQIEFHTFPINDQLLLGLNAELVERMKWFAQNFYTVAEEDGTIRMYNMQCDMQGVRQYGEYKVPTAWYFQINTLSDGSYQLSTGMHPEQ